MRLIVFDRINCVSRIQRVIWWEVACEKSLKMEDGCVTS